MEKRKVWDELFLAYVAELDKDKPVIMAGDFNVAHQEIGTPLCDSLQGIVLSVHPPFLIAMAYF